jgi:mono/diheme cytochrome c family protein
MSTLSRHLRAAAAGPQPTNAAPVEARSTIDKYCLACHNGRLRTAGLALEEIDLRNVPDRAEVWEKVIKKLRSRAMPPPGAPRPDDATSAALVSWLETTLDNAAAKNPEPGRSGIHRLNRAEYANAIRDLLALDIDARSVLPADDQGYGFDNNADLLTMSPGLMDRYMLAARTIARLAVGDPTIRRVVETYHVSRLLTQDDRMGEDVPFGSRGGISIRHHFPLDAEYVLRIRMQGGARRKMGEQLEVRVDGERVTRFTTGGQRADQSAPAEGPVPDPVFETRFAARAGPHVVGVALLKRTSAP